MTPDKRNFDVYQGARWSDDYIFINEVTELPIDFTGLGPFVFRCKNAKTGVTLFDAAITSAYDNTGTMTITLSGAQTALLTVGSLISYGLRDSQDNAYMAGSLSVKAFPPGFA